MAAQKEPARAGSVRALMFAPFRGCCYGGSLRSLDSPFGFAQGRRGGCPHVGILRSTRSVYAGADDFRENEAAVVPNESRVMREISPREMTQ